ncbi:flagellar hook-length control protein FliK [Bacillus sp. V3]|nr:flagellar hook-length control protein FliK [Bacillus sp. V3]
MEIAPTQAIQVKGVSVNGMSSFKRGSASFSQHLLGSLNSSIQQKTINVNDISPALELLNRLLSAQGLVDLGLTDEQIEAFGNLVELDIEDIAGVMNIDLEEIIKLQDSLQAGLPASLKKEESEIEMSLESIVDLLHFVQLSINKNKGDLVNPQAANQLVKMAKALVFIAAQKDLPMGEAQRVSEMNELLKQLQQKTETVLQVSAALKQGNKEEIIRAAYSRHSSMEMTEAVKPEQNKLMLSVQGNNLHTLVHKSESFTMNMGKTKGAQQYEQFVKEFQTILSRSNLQTQPNMNKLLIKLYPEQLGSLRIEILQTNGIMTARILATTSAAKEMLDSQLQGLKHAFTSQNLQVDKIEVSQALADPERQSKGQSHQQNGQSKQAPEDTHKDNEEQEAAGFKEYLVSSEV